MATRRLPGVRFAAQPSPPRDPLPQMDIAVFVGFAASGPLNCPVPIEDPAYLAAIFGEEAILFRDEGGELVRGRLLPAARAFLRNGGRRCWIVRAADPFTARANHHPLPGLMQARLDSAGAVAAISPAFALTRSEGSWSDGLWTGASLAVAALVVHEPPMIPTPGELALVVSGVVQPGDLLRLSYPDGLTVLVAIRSVTPTDTPMPLVRGGERLRIQGTALWLDQVQSADLVGATTATCFFDPVGVSAPVLAASSDLDAITLTLGLTLADAPAPGMIIRVDASGGPLWLVVTAATAAEIAGSTDGSTAGMAVRITGQGVRWVAPPAVVPVATPLGELLSLELVTRMGATDPLRLADLDLVAGAPRWWGSLPTDSELFGSEATPSREAAAALWRAAASPRFPLAGSGSDMAFTFPLILGQLPTELLRARPSADPALQRNGLAMFSPALFLDDAFGQTLTADLLNQADYLRYLAPLPRRLRGVYAALAIDEATLLAAPDATARPWGQRFACSAPPAAAPEPIIRPAWWGHPACAAADEPRAEPAWERFLDATVAIVPAPTLSSDTPDASGSFSLNWSAPAPVARFVLAEATRPGFEDAAVVYEGPATTHTMYGRSAGDYYYRVRAIVGSNTSDWSAGLVVQVGTGGGWARDATITAPNLDLLAIHRAMLRLCAARGDLLAVLSLPDHYREDDAIAHAAALRPARTPLFRNDDLAQPISYGEAVALSYGALYHPWPISRSGTDPAQAEPPDGAVCGLIARRTLARGAWLAPANERLIDVVALTPPLTPSRWLELQEAQINLVRLDRDGAICLSADTLAREPELRPLGVRRLLSLLRRLALREGQNFAFEPFDAALRRLARRDLEAVLADLYRRGAFAGTTPETSYQVVIRSTPQDRDHGRMVIELKIAPSLPLTFLTVRLVQTGGHVVVSEALAVPT